MTNSHQAMLADIPFVDIPFVKQQPVGGDSRTCGAAALSMVYRSLGQSEKGYASIWQDSATVAGDGTRHIRSNHLARHALEHGLAAVCLQTRNLFVSIERLFRANCRVIVNHWNDHETTWGHFSVITRMKAGHIFLHDPLTGPNRSYSQEGFQKTTMRSARASQEVVGGVLVAISERSRQSVEDSECPRCAKPFPLYPSLGVNWRAEWSTDWAAAFCPHCDLCLAPSKHVKQSA